MGGDALAQPTARNIATNTGTTPPENLMRRSLAQPCQTATQVPVTAEADSEARYAITSATASVLTHVDRSASGIARRLPGVSMVLGSTAFTVMPCDRSSRASAFVSAM